MAARRKSTTQNRSVDDISQRQKDAIQRYLDLVDDGELERLAATMAPKGKGFDPSVLIAQASALQAEAAAELVRRRELLVQSMDLATLSNLAGRWGIPEVSLIHIIHDDRFFDDPIQGPVLRRISSLMCKMPLPQEFGDLFLGEKPMDALNRASSRTSLRRPLPGSTLEDLLRFAANIPEESVSWEILNGAFIDFLRLWCQTTTDFNDFRESLTRGPDSEQKESKKSSISARTEEFDKARTRFYDSFTPGHQFSSDIVELVHRAYAECWRDGISAPQWLQRFAWLADEFPPFWQRFGQAYCAIHQARVKAAAEAEAEIRKGLSKRSAEARRKGGKGVHRREFIRWKTVTSDFIRFLEKNFDGPSLTNLGDHVETFVRSMPGGPQLRNNALEFLRTLGTAVTKDEEARSVLETLQRSFLGEIETLEPRLREQRLNKLPANQRNQYLEKGTTPPAWVQFKSLTEEAVRDCLEDLKSALPKARVKKL